jgi:hypothetical protein
MHYTWKVAVKGFKMASMMNKLAMINSCEIILEKQNIFFLPKIIVKFRCALYLYAHYLTWILVYPDVAVSSQRFRKVFHRGRESSFP